ncbi:hypothetical protein I6F07_31195 [Ensifer sp. IC4062]|nr:hypothetical protein [Ensifer sp. IC4062]MCA1444572.1 hypothetical protein [Ensifer sp. IC4062]
MQRKLALLDRAQWAENEEIWKGEFEGNVFGTNVSVIFYTTDEVGLETTDLHVTDRIIQEDLE